MQYSSRVFFDNHLPMPSQIQGIPPNPKVLGAYATPDFNAELMLLFNLLFCIIFTASKA
jgi:hypothetical protein